MTRRRLKSLESKHKESVNSSPSCSDKWTAQLVIGVAAMVVPGILSLPPFHPLLVHILFWPTLALTLVLPIYVFLRTVKSKQLLSVEPPSQAKSSEALKAEAILYPMFLCNFIGLACCRSVHIQFYSWYFYSLPYLLSHTKLSTNFKLLLLGVLELTYFSLEVNTVLGYWYNFGSSNWEYFEYWSKSACAPYISQKRNLDGFEVEIEADAPVHCRRGCSISSLVWQTVHWTILVSVLVNMVKRRRRNYKNSQYG